MKTKKLVTLAMLLAFSLIIFIIEAQLPPLAPIPGIKLGLANIVTLIVMVWFGKKEAFVVLILRIILGTIFAGGFASFLYSISGGLMCFAIMALLFKIFGNNIWVLSIFGAAAHNVGQIITAMIVTSVWQVIWYLPMLTVSAIITGAFTGLTARYVIKHFDKFKENKNK